MNQLIKQAKKFYVDSIKLRVQGGKGGSGLPQYGGIGGKGGDVYIVGSRRNVNLAGITKTITDGPLKAGDGWPSRRTRLLGDKGKDLFIKVPIGVTVTDIDKQFLGDINKENEKVMVAMGGLGGDKFTDNHGFVGQKKTIKLDLKLISDAVLVGFPNAGKSSLIRALSNAKPKVADYPFTTLRPYLGMMQYPDLRAISVADLPGLIEGAHKNLGMGHEFLKHIERTKLMVFLIDVNNVDLGPIYTRRTPFETLSILIREIELFDDSILNKPAIVAVSKMDSVDDSCARFEEFKSDMLAISEKPELLKEKIEESIRPSRMVKFDEIIPISSHNGTNIDKLKNTIREELDKYAELARQDEISSYRELQPLETNRLIQ